MTQIELNGRYFNWLCHFILDRDHRQIPYNVLLEYLFSRNFEYVIPLDENRESDGLNLRYRFGYECGYNQHMIATLIDVRPCSVLEMMVALAVRCEEHLMSNSEFGDRTALWFWMMIDSLGLTEMTDELIDIDQVEEIVTNFLERKFRKNGRGGLFTTEDPNFDMRTTEIWYQLNKKLNELA